jgi:putative membrane protein
MNCAAAVLCGFLLGIITGLTPGVHVNTLLPVIVVLPVTGTVGAVLIFSLAVTHTVLDFIPSTIFGVPDTDTALSVLPAHQLLLEGKGYEAIKLTVLGSLGALIVSCALVVPMVQVIPVLYTAVYPYMGYILLFFCVFIIVSEKSVKKMVCAFLIFMGSGLYGYIVLSSPLVSHDTVLFPVFCGLFGISTILISLKGRNKLPVQSLDSDVDVTVGEIVFNVVKGAAAGILVSLFPGIGPAHATALMSVRASPRQFLIAVSGVNTANAVYALIGLYTLGKARSGAVVAIGDLVHINETLVLMLLSCGLLVTGIASVAALYIARMLLQLITHIPYKKMMGTICVILVITVWIITGVPGVFIMVVGCCIGILPVLTGVRRTHCMGILLFPVLLYYLGLPL